MAGRDTLARTVVDEASLIQEAVRDIVVSPQRRHLTVDEIRAAETRIHQAAGALADAARRIRVEDDREGA